MNETTDTAIPVLLLGEAGSDPIEDRLRETVRATIEAVFDEELAAYLGRIRYEAAPRGRGIATDGASGSSSAPSARKSSACPGPASRPRTAGSPNGARRRCRAISG